jgi:ATP-dependent Clp protease adaptor protein ClpS
MDHQVIKKEQTLEAVKPALKIHPMYRVILLNDDYTPMDFVVKILMLLFGLNEERAVSVMLQVHQEGKGVCGVYTHEIAETKVFQVNQCARGSDHPLLCCMEPDTFHS